MIANYTNIVFIIPMIAITLFQCLHLFKVYEECKNYIKYQESLES
jgi:hypothetical protein